MVTLSVVIGLLHEPLFNVQRNTFVPKLKLETVVVGEFAFEKDPVPEMTVHVPVAGEIGEFPASVVELDGRHTV